jgi:CRP/FNR family transcriptional regulator
VPSCFADRLGGIIELTATEIEALTRLEERERTLRRNAPLLRENDRLGELFVLRSGMMMSCAILDNGSRQILRFLFPGDIIGAAALAYRHAPETVVALSESVVSPFDRSLLTQLTTEHPRLAAAMLALDQIERVMLTDRLAGLGRTSAKARVASILLEVRDRTQHLSARGGDAAFVLGLTQEEIGDATGLTAVHVNRMMRQLEEEGLIGREGGRVTLTNEAALRRAANYVDRTAGLDLGWLPPSR